MRGLWAWWVRGLASWVPLRLRAVYGLTQQRLLLRREGDELSLALTGTAELGEPGEAALREIGRVPCELDVGREVNDDPLSGVLTPRIANLPRWLLLPADSGLRRSLILPAAAGDRLRDVLAFEIDRQTPFTVGEVYYDARVLGRRGDGQINAELVVVPRVALEDMLEALGAPLRATLAGVDILGRGHPSSAGGSIADGVDGVGSARADRDGSPLGVNLLPDAQRHGRRDPAALWNLVLAVVAIAALTAGLWQILANRTAAADAFEVAANQRSQQAKRVSSEKKQLVDLVEGLRFLQTTRSGRPTAVEVLDELSQRLPDNTYVEKVSIEGDKLLVMGLSSEASKLVELLQTSKLWRSMTLTGALQPDPRTGKDRFTLTADLAVTVPDKGAADARRNP